MDKNRGGNIFGTVFVVLAVIFSASWFAPFAADHGLCAQAIDVEQLRRMTPPLDGPLKYPFTKNESAECGHWRPGSQDYPYFGAPRDGDTRKHAGIDLYPAKGAGTPVRAIKDGNVIRVAPFYKRRNGEVTYAVLVDHNDLVANYAELKKPSLSPGSIVKQGQTIGVVSGTEQLHFELYMPGIRNWLPWYGSKMPQGLMDPTDMMIRAFGIKKDSRFKRPLP